MVPGLKPIASLLLARQWVMCWCFSQRERWVRCCFSCSGSKTWLAGNVSGRREEWELVQGHDDTSFSFSANVL